MWVYLREIVLFGSASKYETFVVVALVSIFRGLHKNNPCGWDRVSSSGSARDSAQHPDRL